MSNKAINWARKQKVGNSGAKFILVILADYAGADGGSCFPSLKSIAEDTEQGERTIRRHLDHLEKGGFITQQNFRKKDGRYGHSSYVLHLDREHQTEHEPYAKLANGQIGQRPKTTEPYAKLADGLYIDEPLTEPSQKNKKGFLDMVFRNYRDKPDIQQQAEACWDYWMAFPDRMPSGDLMAGFNGWLRKAKSVPKKSFAGGNAGYAGKKSDQGDKSGVSAGHSMNAIDRQRVKGFYESGFWLDRWGPKPEEDRCQVPFETIQAVKSEVLNQSKESA